MRTFYIPHMKSWGPNAPELTAEQVAENAENDAMRVACDARKAALESSPGFLDALLLECERRGVQIDNLRHFVGSQHNPRPGPYDYADTPEKVVTYYLQETPLTEEQKRRIGERSREAQKQAKVSAVEGYKAQYAGWVRACAVRKQLHPKAVTERMRRHSEARNECAAKIEAAKQELNNALVWAENEYTYAVSDIAPPMPAKNMP